MNIDVAKLVWNGKRNLANTACLEHTAGWMAKEGLPMKEKAVWGGRSGKCSMEEKLHEKEKHLIEFLRLK